MSDTVFITGADKGLGLALVEKFLSAGLRVFAGQYSVGDNLQTLAVRFPQTLAVVPLDVTSLDSVRRAARIVAEQTDALDVLINNAGIFIRSADVPLEQLDLADQNLERTLDVNTYGPLRVTQQFLPLLRKGRRKRIINISSEAGSVADCTRDAWYAYCMSKAALNMQSKILHNYLALHGFKVLAVHPGWMRTDMGGPEAELDPAESAAGIFDLAMRDWSPDDPIYVDYRGRPMRW